MTLTYLLIFILATWRISSLLVREDGPFFLFKRLRERAGIEHGESGDVFMVPETFWAGMLSCVWCCSMWVAFSWFVFWVIWPEIAVMCGMPFAVSAGAILLERVTG